MMAEATRSYGMTTRGSNSCESGEGRKREIVSIQAEQAATADRAGRTALRGMSAFPPALLLNQVIRHPAPMNFLINPVRRSNNNVASQWPPGVHSLRKTARLFALGNACSWES